MIYIVDLEANGLLNDKKGKKADKIHCLSVGWINERGEFQVKSTTDYNQMKKIFLDKDNTIIGHYFILYDIILLETLLGFKAQCKFRDTLGISWYLEPLRKEHSVETYAIEQGTKKEEIEDWENLPVEEYIRRCEKDVRIQYQIWLNQLKHLQEIYDNDENQIERILDYISFKLLCFKEQQEEGLKFDLKLAKKTLKELKEEKEKKTKVLEAAMPKTPIYGVRKMPKKMYNSKSELSSLGLKWNQFLKDNNLPLSHMEDIKYITGYNEPNCNSYVQLKDWLFSLGWKPQNIKHNRNKKTGETSKVPQLQSIEKDGNLCPSVIKLVQKEPALETLQGLSIINHRISVFEGLLRDEIEGRLYQNIGGLTNTLRATHRILVNLPKPTVPYGKEIRGCLITDNENTLLCNADLSGLEDNTKQHYIYNYDPEYVKEMRTPGFSPHLDIGVRAGLMTEEDSDFYKKYEFDKDNLGKDFKPTLEEKNKFNNLKEIRYVAKTTNFAATYGAFPKRIAITANITLAKAEELFDIYWERNKAVNQTAEACKVKTIRGQMWLFNPISKFWYSLRYEKDRFSTLNQGSAVFTYDVWLGFVRQHLKIPFQMHDELMFNCLKSEKEKIIKIINNAMKQTNDLLKLNVKIGCSIEFGQSYANCH